MAPRNTHTQPTVWLVLALLGSGCTNATSDFPEEAPPAGPGAGGAGGTGGGASGGTGGAGGGADDCAALGDALQAALDDVSAARSITGTAARVTRGDCSWEGASGLANLDTAEAMEADALYRIGSSTKTFVAAALLLEVAEGHVSLDDSIDAWAPGLPNADEITLRQALNHTSGVFNYTEDEAFWMADPAHVWTPEEIVGLAANHPALFAPGAGWSYSNTNYAIAGLALEAASGQPIAQAIRERILTPLGLAETWFDGEETAVGPLSPSYIEDGGQLYECTYYWDPSGAWAAGAIASSNRDVERFYRALLGGEILAPAELAEMQTFVDLGEGYGYGLGLFSFPSPLGGAFGHGGDIPGFSSDNRVVPGAGVSIAQFVNIFDYELRDAVTLALEQVLAAQ